MFKLYSLMYAIVIMLAVLSRLFQWLEKEFIHNIFMETFVSFTEGISFAACFGAVVIWLVVTVLRFRNNLLKDEGYLMNTLPVSTGSLVWSKLLSSLVLLLLTVFAIFIAVSININSITWLKEPFDELMACKNPAFVIITLVVYLLIAALSSTSLLYVCLSFGYRSSRNRDLMSIVTYVIIYWIHQVLAVLVIVATYAIFNPNNFISTLDKLFAENTPDVMPILLIPAGILLLVELSVYVALTTHNLKKHLNLE